MDSMVERVARKLARQACDPLLMSAISIGLYEDKRWHDYEGKAVAAIKAMMEPTLKMVEAGQAVDGTIAAEEVWQAMLSAALSDTEGR